MCARSTIGAVVAEDEVWNRFTELDRFVQNRRLLYFLAQSLSVLPASSTKFPALGWCLRSSMLTASNRYRDGNGLAKLSEEKMQMLFADILCATMLGPSFHVGRSLRSEALQCCLRDAALCREAVAAGDVVLHRGAHTSIADLMQEVRGGYHSFTTAPILDSSCHPFASGKRAAGAVDVGRCGAAGLAQTLSGGLRIGLLRAFWKVFAPPVTALRKRVTVGARARFLKSRMLRPRSAAVRD